MQDNRLEKLIGDKLREYREEPAPDLFGRIEGTLAGQNAAAGGKTVRKRGLPFYAARIGAAAIILVGLVLGYTLLRNDKDMPLPTDISKVSTSDTDNNTSHTDTKAVAATGKKQGSAKEDNSGHKTTSVSDILRKAIEEDPRAADIMKIVAESRNTSISGGNSIESVMTELPLPDLVLPTIIEDNTPRSTEQRIPLYSEAYWNEIFREERKPRNDRRLVASVFGGNLGLGNGDYRSHDASAVLSSKMNINEFSGMADVNRAPAGGEAVESGDFMTKSTSDQIELTHKMPVNFGITLAYPLTERLSIVSGLNYSYLRSESKKDSGMADYKMKRDIHYIGIPLGVSYTFYSARKFDFYIYGGGMIEKAVSARDVTKYLAGSGDTEIEKKFTIKGVQPSLRVTAGASFDIARGVSIYVEPGVAYYFEQINAVSTYRTEHPTSFSLSLGVRFGL